MIAARKTSEVAPTAAFTPEEISRRRAQSRRLAWLLGAVALIIYLVGFICYTP